MKKFFAKLFTFIAVFGLMFALASCDLSEFLNLGNEETSEESEQVKALSRQAVAAVSAIESDEENVSYAVADSYQSAEANDASAETTEETVVTPTEEATAEDLEGIINQGDILTSDDIVIRIEASDAEGYAFKLVVTYIEEEYIVYVEFLREDVKEEGKHNFKYHGKACHNGKEYEFEVSEDVELDEGEEQIEMELEMKYGKDKAIKIKRSFEYPEIELDNKKISFTFEFMEDQDIVLEYKFNKKNVEGCKDIEYEFNGKRFEFGFRHEEGKKKVDITSDDFEYTLEIEDEAIKEIIDNAIKDFLDNLPSFDGHRPNHPNRPENVEDTPAEDAPVVEGETIVENQE